MSNNFTIDYQFTLDIDKYIKSLLLSAYVDAWNKRS